MFKTELAKVFAARHYGSICLSRSYILSKRIDIFEFFSPSGSHTILVFRYQTGWQYSNGGVECRWGRQKSRFWTYIWLHCPAGPAASYGLLQQARCCQYDAAGPPYARKLWHLSPGPALACAGPWATPSLLPFPSTSSFSSPPPLPLPRSSLPLRSRAPIMQLGGLGERCKLPQQIRNRIWCILALKYDIWWQQF